MPNHQENSQRILKYLSYLRDVSRKIVTRNGFEKCYLNKPNKYAIQIEMYKAIYTNLDAEYQTYNGYYEQVKLNPDKKLFIGFGLVCGLKQNKMIAGPLVYMQCDIDKDDDNSITVEFGNN